MDSPTGDLCCLFSLQRPLLDFEGACLCVWPRCHSGALMYGCSLCLSLSLSLSNRVCILSLCLSCFFSVLSCLSLFFCLVCICVLCPGLTMCASGDLDGCFAILSCFALTQFGLIAALRIGTAASVARCAPRRLLLCCLCAFDSVACSAVRPGL